MDVINQIRYSELHSALVNPGNKYTASYLIPFIARAGGNELPRTVAILVSVSSYPAGAEKDANGIKAASHPPFLRRSV